MQIDSIYKQVSYNGYYESLPRIRHGFDSRYLLTEKTRLYRLVFCIWKQLNYALCYTVKRSHLLNISYAKNTHGIFIIIPIILFIILITGYTPTYISNLARVKQLNQTKPTLFSCDNNYAWQVSIAAFTMPRNFLEGGGGKITATQTLQLLRSNKAVVLGGQTYRDVIGPAESSTTLSVMAPFQKAYVIPELLAESEQYINQIKQDSNPSNEKYRSNYYIHSANISDADFTLIANCFAKNITEINKVYTKPVIENTDHLTSANLPFGALILQRDTNVNELNYMGYTCDDKRYIYTYGNTLELPTKASTKLVGIVDFHGTIHPRIIKEGDSPYREQSFPPKPTDTWALQEFEALKDRIATKNCLNGNGQNIKDVIQSIPNRIEYIK